MYRTKSTSPVAQSRSRRSPVSRQRSRKRTVARAASSTQATPSKPLSRAASARSSSFAYTLMAQARAPAAGTRRVRRASCLSVVPLLEAGEDLFDRKVRCRDARVRSAVVHPDPVVIKPDDTAREDRVVEQAETLVGGAWREDRRRRAR